MLLDKRGCLVEAAKSGELDYMIHNANCQSTMGSGVAKAIRSAYPQAYLVDKEDYRSPIEKIGSYTCVKIGKLTIINLYCQYDFGYDGMRRFEYGAFKRALDEICRDFSFTGKSIGLPLLGSGLAAGDPDLIREILSWYATDGTWTIYHL